MPYGPQPNRPPRQQPPKRRKPRRQPKRRATPPPYAAPPPAQQPPYPQPPYQQPQGQYAGSPRKQRRGRRGFNIGPGIIFGCIGIVGVVMLGFLVAFLVAYDFYSGQLDEELDKLENIANYESFESSVLYDRDGNKLYELIDEGRRVPIGLDQVPQHMIEATIALEDDTFYENRGIDVPSIVRAGWQYVRYGYIVSGGSTITQQLIRNVLFTDEYKYEQSLNRKLDEALLAVSLTQRMSKDEILELYLNEIPYGNLAYGIEAAAQTYFGKPAAQLTLGEAALLAGLPQAPANLDPLNPDPEVQRRVMQRRKLVLDLMVEEGYITRAEANAAYAEPLNFVSPDIRLENAPHMVVYAQDQLEDLLTRELSLPQDEVRRMIARGGLHIYTSVDLDFQRLAEDMARQQVAALKASRNMNNAAVVIIHPITGEILAMVGSVNYDDESIDGQVNMANAVRQPGSAMKPFTYAAALERGWTPANVIWDTRIRVEIPGSAPYEPVNYDNSWHGPVRVREALANSYNIPAVQTLRTIGLDYFIWMMNRVGVSSLQDPSNYGPALTLGGGEVTPLELTTAYATLANGGVYVPNTAIVCVTNSAHEIIYEYEQRCPADARLTGDTVSVRASGQPVMDPRIAFIISHILADNQARTPAMGSNSPLYTPGIPTSAKTGTTNDFRDNWTVGFTRNIAVGVWTGNTDNAEMYNVSGLDGAAPIWNSIMNGIYSNPALLGSLANRQPDDAHLQPPGGVFQRQLCNITRTSLRDPAVTCSPGAAEWFLDSPALVPDGSGNMIQSAPPQSPPQSANGPQPQEIEPGLIKVAVYPVEPGLANAIAAADPSGRAVPPKYCQVPVEVLGMVPGVQEQLFVAPPGDRSDDYYARSWAYNAGVAILPLYACNEQMLSAGTQQVQAAPGFTAQITEPAWGQTYSVGQPIAITGTASFGGNGFFKVEIRGGQFPNWTTIGEVNSPKNQSGVVNGVLEQIGGGALQPGSYELQLVIVGPDGNYAATTQTAFTVAG